MGLFQRREKPKQYYVFSGRPIIEEPEIDLDDDETLYERPSIDFAGVDPRVAAHFRRVQHEIEMRRASQASTSRSSRQASVATNASEVSQAESSRSSASKISRLFKRRKAPDSDHDPIQEA